MLLRRSFLALLLMCLALPAGAKRAPRPIKRPKGPERPVEVTPWKGARWTPGAVAPPGTAEQRESSAWPPRPALLAPDDAPTLRAIVLEGGGRQASARTSSASE